MQSLGTLETDAGDVHRETAESHLRSGKRAVTEQSLESAKAHFTQARDLSLHVDDPSMLLQCSLSLGQVLASIDDPSTASVLASVYPLARKLGDDNAYARAALAELIGAPSVLVPMQADHRVTQRLKHASRLLVEPHTAAHLLIALATQQADSITYTEFGRLLDQAQVFASSATHAELDDVMFAARVCGRRRPQTLQQDRDLIEQRVTESDTDPNLGLLDIGVLTAFWAGDLEAAHTLLQRYKTATENSVMGQWRMLRAQAALSFARGSIEAARKQSLAALQVVRGTRIEPESLVQFGFQITALLRERYRFEDVRPTVETWVEEDPSDASFRATRALVRMDLGDSAGARSDLEIFFARDLQEQCGQRYGLYPIAQAVETAARLADDQAVEWCRRGHELLQPFLDQWITVGDVSLLQGPVSRVAALASSAVGEIDLALEENDAARTTAQNAGASLFIWHAIRDRGQILDRAGRPADAVAQLAEAAVRYRSAGLVRQAESIENQAATIQSTTSRRGHLSIVAPSSGEFRRHQNVWHVMLDGEQVSIRHLRGMSMIHALLGAPGQELAASTLGVVADGEPISRISETGAAFRAQSVIDTQAVAAYRQRLDEIVSELDRADTRGDVAASERLSKEFDGITRELDATHGLGGRTRQMIDEGERARVRVTKSIRASIRRVNEYHPRAAAHLEQTVKTGRFCVYQPDPRHRVDWHL